MDQVLPVGLDGFCKIREGNFYYIDKTKFIAELLKKPFEVNLITRPRRFGKTLTMSMLSEFFDIQKDSRNIFDGLAVSRDRALCDAWMNQYPVLFLTLKSIESSQYEIAYDQLKATISDLCLKHMYLNSSQKVNEVDREIFRRLAFRQASQEELCSSLFILMRMMVAHFGKSVILLIDEYDVPLAKASENGYYEPMLDMIRSMLGKTLKTNEFLKFAVITGCLRIAQESIFTGTNNFVSDTISGRRFDEYFGFTGQEVAQLLQDTGFEDHAEEMRIWYDGYRFGSVDVYCPWDVLNHVNRLQDVPEAKPENYWKNTSHNGIIRSFIERTDLMVNEKFETLLSGGCIRERICEDLTYDMLHASESNLWSILYATGYLTQASREPDHPGNMQVQGGSISGGEVWLKIPNQEIKEIFAETISAWFCDKTARMNRSQLFHALWNGDAAQAEEMISDLLFDTISYFDYKEDFYHAFLTGIFAGAGYAVESNREHGLGRTDIVVRDRSKRSILIMEVKCAKSRNGLERKCTEAECQIARQQYALEFTRGYRHIFCYGVAFFAKECRIGRMDVE